MNGASRFWRAVALMERPRVAATAALVVYAAFALWHGRPGGVSPFPYYAYLADAFLHGQTSLRLGPPDLHDLSVVDGRVYLYWGPFPALVFLPFVALRSEWRSIAKRRAEGEQVGAVAVSFTLLWTFIASTFVWFFVVCIVASFAYALWAWMNGQSSEL